MQSTAAYSFKGLSQIIKLMAELGTVRVREGKGEPTRYFDSERFGHQEEKLECARSLEPLSGRGQIDANGKRVVAASVARYIARISETKLDSDTISV